MVVAWCAVAAIAAPAQTLTTLTSFTGANGANPAAAVVQAVDGNFYGTTLFGGSNGSLCNNPPGCGTLYKITPSGTLTVLHNFCSQTTCPDGVFPQATLVQATDGNLYGTTTGNYDPVSMTGSGGTVFKITTGGTLTTLYSFCSQTNCPDGNGPNSGVIQANDGSLYGATYRGGTSSQCPYTYGCGTIFKISAQGALTTLYNFCGQANCTDGRFPQGALIQGSDGNLYGTTNEGGTNCNGSCGTVFKITLAGTLTTLHSFSGADGANPSASLLEGVDGNFYGTTSGNPGTVFKMTPGGSISTLHTFSGTDGTSSNAALVQATDGNFYGTTRGPISTLFKINSGGVLTTVYLFCTLPQCADGDQPQAAMVQGIDGNLYGTTYGGGQAGNGTVFRLSGPTPQAVQFRSVPPCRLADTRQSAPIQGGTWQYFVVPQLGTCNVPVNATAYSLNVTVVPHQPLGYLTIWPAGRPQPFVSTMNSPDARVKANAAIVAAGGNGAVSVFATDTTDVILDVNGYFTPAMNTFQFFPVTPCRVVDTRQGAQQPQGLGPPLLHDMETRDLPILTSPCLAGINTPEAYAFNITVVPSTGHSLNYLTLWPSDQQQPFVSTLNNPTATVVANAAIVPAAANGDVNVFAFDSTDLIVDVTGYFAARSQGGLSFYSVAPCRAYDSRANNGQPFRGTRVVDIVDSACAPSSSARSYVFNATVVPTNGPMGFLTLWPDSEGQPIASTLNAYDGFTTSNMAIVPNVNGSIDAYADGLTHLILDISGYFAP